MIGGIKLGKVIREGPKEEISDIILGGRMEASPGRVRSWRLQGGWRGFSLMIKRQSMELLKM